MAASDWGSHTTYEFTIMSSHGVVNCASPGTWISSGRHDFSPEVTKASASSARLKQGSEPATTRRFLGAARGMHYLYRALLERVELESPLPRRRVRPSRGQVLSGVFRAWRDTAVAG